jgi:hypothetical protein
MPRRSLKEGTVTILRIALIFALAAIVIASAGCASTTVVDELGGRHALDNTLRCDVELNGNCLQWSRTRSLRSVRQEP